jgi:Na+-transporting NADH:ubiquinone oxidoreductase subunit C
VKGSLYTLGYAGVLGAVCALLLTSAARFTAPYKEANADAEKKRNILSVLEVPYPAGVSPRELVNIFEANVSEQVSAELNLYRYVPPKDSGNEEAVAVAFEGPGLWGPIKGFLALAPDMRSIRGITFYEHEETPGLGGEIASAQFREQFKGKQIMDEAGNAGIIIRGRGDESAVNEVDAITGATMTCDKVQQMLDSVITKIVQENNKNGQ